MSETIYQHLIKHIANVERDVASHDFHELPIGGRMAYYVVVHDSVELVQAVKAATDISLPYLVIGQAESVIIHDDGFQGLVIHNQSKNIAFSLEQSQLVVETGASLQAVVVQAAERGLGGLINLYEAGGSIGGALFYNARAEGQALVDSLRSLTVLMPPTKMKPEPTIVRYKGSWLLSKGEDNLTRLQTLSLRNPQDPQPVILTAQFQLTSLRADEVARRLQTVTKRYHANQPSKHLGPLFADLPENLATDALAKVDLGKFRYPGFVLSRSYPNFFTVKSRFLRDAGGTIPVSEFQSFFTKVQEYIYTRTMLELPPAFLVH